MPADLSKPSPDEPPPGADVGSFRQGSPLSQWALARYLVGRAIASSVSASLLVVALVIFAFAALIEWGAHSTGWAVLVAVLGLMVLAVRGVIRLVLRKLTAADHYGPLEARLNALVSETRRDILSELRRVGLPGRTWTLPLLAFRLARRTKRAQTLERLRAFDVDRAVTPLRVDELHNLMRAATGRQGRRP